jgi:GntR family transcriptional regulator / MocR family aminotransferase
MVLAEGPNYSQNSGPMDLFAGFEAGTSKRTQLERRLRDAIRSGHLRASTQLPPSRVLAAELKVSRGVVVEAYAQLTAEGYLVAAPRAGTRVNERAKLLPEPAPGEVEDHPPVRFEMRSGVVDPASFPRRAWVSTTDHALRSLSDAALLGPHRGGLAELKLALSDYVARTRAAAATPDRMVVTCGVAQGLTLVLTVLRARGALRIAVEDPSWPLHARAVRTAGLEPVAAPVDGRGLQVDCLDRLKVDAVIATPAHQFPTGVVLAPERRAALLDWATRRQTLVLEDDYDAEYRYDRDPIAALQGMHPDRVVYAGTVSKMLAPTLRIGWLLLPADICHDVAHAAHASGAWPSIIDQYALATLIQRGNLERHLRATRRRYRTRRDALIEALTERLDTTVEATAAGLHVVAWLPDGVDAELIAVQARARGIALDTLASRCWTRAAVPPALLLGFAALPEAALRRAVDELARLPAAAPLRIDPPRPRPPSVR